MKLFTALLNCNSKQKIKDQNMNNLNNNFRKGKTFIKSEVKKMWHLNAFEISNVSLK